MKKNILLIAVMLGFATVGANAQSKDSNLFNHLAIGVTAGTTGIGFDAAMPIGNYVYVRAGVDFMPNIKINTDLDIDAPDISQYTTQYEIPEEIEVEGKIGFTNGKLLFDVYPFKGSSFHVTAGAYFGSSKIVKAYNRKAYVLQDLYNYNQAYQLQKIGVELGDYFLEPDQDGNVEASIKTASFKPYLGLGFGRAVPKNCIGFMFDLGVQFWGSPKIYCFDQELTEEGAKGEDGGVIKTLSKITVYPVINFRLCGRIL